MPRDGSIRIFCVQYSEFPDSKPLSYQKTLFPWDAVVISPLNAFHPRWRHLVALTRVNILDRRLGTLWPEFVYWDDHNYLQIQSLVREFPKVFLLRDIDAVFFNPFGSGNPVTIFSSPSYKEHDFRLVTIFNMRRSRLYRTFIWIYQNCTFTNFCETQKMWIYILEI